MQIEAFRTIQLEKLRASFMTTVRCATQIRRQIGERYHINEIYTTLKLYAAHHDVTLC